MTLQGEQEMKKITVALFGLALSGCATGGPDETAGTLIGAAGGALIGSQFGSGSGQIAATAIGTLGGAFAGNQIGKHFDEENESQGNE